MLSLTPTFAQHVFTWKGGTPGQETNWNEPRNWSTYQVPDEFSHVVIKRLHTGHYAQPVIEQEVEVASIQVHTGASLTIKTGGQLLIDGEYAKQEELTLFGGTLLMNETQPVDPLPKEEKSIVPRIANQ